MREQLAQALATQQSLKVEKEQAVEQCRIAQECAARLQTQLELLRNAHSEYIIYRHYIPRFLL